MLFLPIMLPLLAVADSSAGHKIVGGESTLIEKYPYMANIIMRRKPFCAGSIISKNTVLTAGQCLMRRLPGDFTVVVGDTNSLGHDGQHFMVKWMEPHPKYNHTRGPDYDTGIIRVCGEFEFTASVRSVELSSDHLIPVGVEGTLAGWGDQKVEIKYAFKHKDRGFPLKVVHIPIIDADTCQRAYFPAIQITETMLCTWNPEEHRDACSGDSGGPLVVYEQQIGIVSFGIGCGSTNPSVYTRVSAVLDWIHENMALD